MKDGQFPWQERKGQEEDLRCWDVRRCAPGGVQGKKSAGRAVIATQTHFFTF